jgi:Uma2 family endonuclease
MSSEVQTYIGTEEYLAFERKAENRNEYIDGKIFATASTNRSHNLIVGNTIRELGQQLKETPSEVYAFKMRVKAPAAQAYIYPDVAIVCDEPRFEDDYFDTLLNPTLVIEVLSKSTGSNSRPGKAGFYRTIESLTEYLLVAQEEYRVEQYVRLADERWLLSDVRSLDSAVDLNSIGCSLTLRDIYHRVSTD